MFALSALIQRELKSWSLSAVFYSHGVLFSFFSLAAMFLLSNFMEANAADLSHAFFRWHPWIFAMTAPVIGIRSWSEEHHGGVFEVLGTQPIRMSQLVLAKACGAFSVVAFSLICTFPAVVTVLWLGKPDVGAIASGYLGSFLCGCAFAAVSQAVCAFMRGSIGAYVCSVALCFVLILSGITHVANIILGTFPSLEWATKILAALSISPKFEPFFEGRIELAGVLGFLLLIGLSLALCLRALLAQRGSRKKSFGKKIFSYGAPIWLALSIYVLLAVGASVLPGRIDMTEGKRFGLPKLVAEELDLLEREVTVRLFATTQHPQFGFDLVRYERRINEILKQVIDKSNAKVTFEMLDPNLDSRAARIAAIDEVRSFNYDDGDPFMFGMVVESLNNKRVFDVIDPKRERHFITDLIQAILDVGRSDRKTIGVLSVFDQYRTDSLAPSNWTGIDILKKSYDLRYIEVDSDWNNPDIIVLHHPVKMNSKLSDKLESYVKQGGDLIVLVDPFSLMGEAFADGGGHLIYRSTLPDFILDRGINFVNDRQVYDFALSTEEPTENGRASNPAILTLGAEQFNPDHAITAGFDYVQFFNVGSIDVSPVEGYDTVELMRTSTQALLLDTKIAEEKNSKKVEQAMGELELLEKGFTLMALQSNLQNENEGRLLIVSDADWLYGAVTGVENEDGRLDAYNSNIGLMRNMVDFLAGDRALRELRLRSLAKRPLQYWDEMSREIAEPFREPIASLSEEIDIVEENLFLIDRARQLASTQTQRNAQTERQISSLKTDLRLRRGELSSLRSEREAKVQMRLSIIKWMNVLIIPLFVALIGILVTLLRARKIRGIGA